MSTKKECNHGEPDPYLPDPYCKHCGNHGHFDHPEALARSVVSAYIDRDSWQIDSLLAYGGGGGGFYGHEWTYGGDSLVITQCGGKDCNEVFNFRSLLQQEKEAEHQASLFA